MEVRPTMTRIPAHRPTCTHTASKHRDAQRTSSSSTKTVLRNRLHTHQPWPTPLALLQRDQTTPPKPPSKTDAATSPILRFQRARTCARTPLAPPQPPPDSDRFGATTACAGSARMERCRRSGSQWTEHRLAVPSPSPSALGIVWSFPSAPQGWRRRHGARRARKVNTAVFQGEEDRSSAEAKGEESGDRQRRECPPGPGYAPIDPRERESL